MRFLPPLRPLVAAALLLPLVGPVASPAQATTYLGGTFVMHRADTFGSKYMNVGMAGVAVSGSLRGAHLRISAYQFFDCETACVYDEWLDFRFRLTSGTDQLWGGCYRFAPGGDCKFAGIEDTTGAVDFPGGVAGGSGQFAGATGSFQLSGYLVPANVDMNADEEGGELRLVLRIS